MVAQKAVQERFFDTGVHTCSSLKLAEHAAVIVDDKNTMLTCCDK